MEELSKSPEDLSVIHTAFIRRCIHIAHHYGSNLALCDHEMLKQLPEAGYPSDMTIGKRHTARMPHLPFANRWLYTLYNEQGAALLNELCICRGGVPVGEVSVEHMSMGQPTRTRVSYIFGSNKRVYASATIDNEQPPPAALSFMAHLGVPVRKLGWDARPPYRIDSWDSDDPLDGMHVLAIMRVVNSHFTP